jgi:hypothetical protein
MMAQRLPTPKYGAVNLDILPSASVSSVRASSSSAAIGSDSELPTLEDAVFFEAKVEVMTCRPMFFYQKYRHINDPMEYIVSYGR